MVTFKDVEFGEHTITVTKDGTTLSRSLTISRGDSTSLKGSTLTAKGGASAALTVRLDGGLKLVSAWTANPAAGDETHLAQFTAVALVSLLGLGAVAATLCSERRKEEN